MKPVNVSTKRTAVNFTVITAIVGVIAKVTGWQLTIEPEDLIWLSPIIGVVGGVGYRLSRAITTKWPWVGWVVFGSGKEPAGLRPITANPPEGS